MRTIEDVRTALRDDADSAQLDTATVDEALARGRTRRRTRIVAIAGGAAAVAALAITIPLVVANPTPTNPDGIVATGSHTVARGPITTPYAIGSTITDGGTTFDIPGTVVALGSAGGRYAVVWAADDGAGARLSIADPDGTMHQTDVVPDAPGLATGVVDGVPVAAVGGSTVQLVDMRTGERQELAAPGFLVGVGPDGVVYVPSDRSSSLGPPTVWDGTNDPRALLGDTTITRAIGDGVAIVYDPATECTSAINVTTPDAPLWRDCGDSAGLRSYTPGLLSPDGEHLVAGSSILDARTGATTTTLDVSELAMTKANPHGSVAAVWESATTLLVSGATSTSSHLDAIYRCDALSGACAALPGAAQTPTSAVFAGGSDT